MNKPSTVLMIHGTADCAANWDRWRRWLAERSYRVEAVDLPGHGEGAFAPCSVDDCTTYLEPLVIRLQPDILLGHSLGGTVAIQLAARRLVPIRRLLLVCPALAIPWPTRLFYDWFVEQPLALLYAQRHWLSPLLARESPRMATANRTDPEVIRQVWYSLRDWQAPVWQEIAVPTAFLTGQWDHIAPPCALEPVVHRLPEATLTVVSSRHLPMDDTPTAFEQWLLAHLPEPE